MGLVAMAVTAAVTGWAAAPAHAGSVLLSRESTIRASGKAGAGDFDLIDGSKDFSGFADMVDTTDAGVSGAPRLSASQNSRPAGSPSDNFTGAFAEGSASAGTGDGVLPAGESHAASNFDLTFQVLGAPSLVTFGGSVGVTGSGSTSVSLHNESTGEVVLSQELLAGSGEGQSIEHSTVLQPGVYELCVQALVSAGDVSDSMAYYTVSLNIAPTGGNVGGPPPPAQAIPLPPAAWSALGAAGLAGLLQKFRRRHPAIA